MHWMVWERMIEPKDGRGMGFRDLESFNTAILGKQIWRLITKPNLLMSEVIRGKYFPNGDIFQAESKSWDSWLWKS